MSLTTTFIVKRCKPNNVYSFTHDGTLGDRSSRLGFGFVLRKGLWIYREKYPFSFFDVYNHDIQGTDRYRHGCLIINVYPQWDGNIQEKVPDCLFCHVSYLTPAHATCSQLWLPMAKDEGTSWYPRMACVFNLLLVWFWYFKSCLHCC